MDLDKAIKNNLTYYKRVHEELKARKTRSNLTHLRKNWLEKQKVDNYQREYDRIRGMLDNSLTGQMTQNILNKRKKDLEELGAKIIDQIV
jgi:hypothetical protein